MQCSFESLDLVGHFCRLNIPDIFFGLANTNEHFFQVFDFFFLLPVLTGNFSLFFNFFSKLFQSIRSHLIACTWLIFLSNFLVFMKN